MKTLAVLAIAVFTLLACTITALSATINIPDDYATIQAGIDASSDGDTVLVQPGTYVENINFNGHSIVLGSLYLTTGSSSYISSTIIDGDSSGTVIAIGGGCDSTTMLCGFTITNGCGVGGGGVYISGAGIIKNNIISHNIASGVFGGGGIYVHHNMPKKVKIIDNEISYNIAPEGYGGGIYIFDSFSPVIQGNTISNNYANQAGGICAATMGHFDIIINENVVDNNQAASYYGGIKCHGYSGEIAFNIISNNKSTGIGGGVGLYRPSTPNFHHNLVYGNTVYPGSYSIGGGGIYILQCSPLIYNNTIINNGAVNGAGGGLFADLMSYSELRNNIIHGNSADSFSQVYDYEDTLIAIHCDIEDGWEGAGNIDCDPMFCNPNNDDYYLAFNSCCVGAGCDSLGNPDSTVHIGAYDIGCYSGDSCVYLPGDINDDGLVIGGDVIFGVRYFKGSGNPPLVQCYDDSAGSMLYSAGDVNGDCHFMGSDITYFVRYFSGEGSPLQWCPQTPPLEE